MTSSPALNPGSAGRRHERLWSALNRNPGRTLATLLLFYLILVCGQAATKLLWGDELITLAIAQQGSLPAIWHALTLGADPNPPMMHWMVLWSTRLIGGSSLAIRTPAILCVLLAIMSLWTVLRRWVAPGYAAAGVLAFMATRGFDYAYDARSYAPLLGFGMASLALWLAANDAAGLRRGMLLTGMTLALALGLSSNYYGVLAFFPIAAGEALRQARLRRFSLAPWSALAAASLPLLAFLPLIRHNIAEFGPHAWNPPRAGMIAESYLVLVEGVFWPVLALALYAWWLHRRSTRTSTLRMQPHELLALGTLLAYPVLGYAIALGGAGLISPRCVVPVCCGFGIAAAVLCQYIFAKSARAGIAVLGLALVWVVAREATCAVVLAQQRSAFFSLLPRPQKTGATTPILVADSLFVLPLAHYTDASTRNRIVFPIDFDAIHRVQADDSGEQNLWAGRNGVFPIRIIPFTDLPWQTESVLVIAPRGGWLTRQLARQGYRAADARSPDPAWQRLGGLFTPMAHPETAFSCWTRGLDAPHETPADVYPDR